MKITKQLLLTALLASNVSTQAFIFDFFNEWTKYNIVNCKALAGNGMGDDQSDDQHKKKNLDEIWDPVDEQNATHLSDIAGGVPQEVTDLVDMLARSDEYTSTGAQLPTGYLLVGPPGTGKTSIARALANELNAPFIYKSGSSFTEMYIGVGPQRVRQLFLDAQEALKKNNATHAIIFIDEIDALGSRERANGGGADSEIRNTINELLTHMDGFKQDRRIIVIGATNRPDFVDPALKRPGRLEYTIEIPLPNRKARAEILDLYLNDPKHKRQIDSSIDTAQISEITAGFSGADLKSVVNSAAITVAREKRTTITQNDLKKAVHKLREMQS